MRALVAIVAASSLLASCEIFDDGHCGASCGPVGPPVEVIVEGIVGATVTIERTDDVATTTECGGEAQTYCIVNTGTASPVGTYLVHAEAAGYVPADLQVVVEATPPGGCCNPGFVPESITIVLVPE